MLSLLSPLAAVAGARATLDDLAAFKKRYPSFHAFLADRNGQLAYRELVKSYMGYDDRFDPIFDKTLEQQRQLAEEAPEFHAQLWRQAPAEEPIAIAASKVRRSGLESDRSSVEGALAALVEHYKTALKPMDPKVPLQKYQDKALRELGAIQARYPETLRNPPSQRALKRINSDPTQRALRMEYANAIRDFVAKDEAFVLFRSRLRHLHLTNEAWLDVYRRGFAEDTLAALEDLDRLDAANTGVADVVQLALPAGIHPDLRPLLRNTDPLYLRARDDFERVRKAKREINRRETPTPPQELADELAAIEAAFPAIQPYQAMRLLSAPGKAKFHQFSEARRNVFLEKSQILNEAEEGNLFRVAVIQQADQLSIEVRRQTSEENVLRPMDPFAASFAGRKTMECVGGACQVRLTPRRHALSAAKGVRSYAAERGGVFDGVGRVIPVYDPQSKAHYDVVDLMIQSIAATTELQSPVTGQSAKYPLFDCILDRLVLSPGAVGFVASDGRAISQNTGLARVIGQSPAVQTRVPLPEATRLEIEDSALVAAINRRFPNSAHGYNPGGMVFEAMPGDGKARFVLTPQAKRPKLSQAALEQMLFEQSFRDPSKVAEHPAWTLAVENDVKLRPLFDYVSVGVDSRADFALALRGVLDRAVEGEPEKVWAFLGSERAALFDGQNLESVVSHDRMIAASAMDAPPEMLRFLRSERARLLKPERLITLLLGTAHQGGTPLLHAGVFDILAKQRGESFEQVARELITLENLSSNILGPMDRRGTKQMLDFLASPLGGRLSGELTPYLPVVVYFAIRKQDFMKRSSFPRRVLEKHRQAALDCLDVQGFLHLLRHFPTHNPVIDWASLFAGKSPRTYDRKLANRLRSEPFTAELWSYLTPVLGALIGSDPRAKPLPPYLLPVREALQTRLRNEPWPREAEAIASTGQWDSMACSEAVSQQAAARR